MQRRIIMPMVLRRSREAQSQLKPIHSGIDLIRSIDIPAYCFILSTNLNGLTTGEVTGVYYYSFLCSATFSVLGIVTPHTTSSASTCVMYNAQHPPPTILCFMFSPLCLLVCTMGRYCPTAVLKPTCYWRRSVFNSLATFDVEIHPHTS